MKRLVILISLLLPILSLATEVKVLTWNVFLIPKPINFSKQQDRAKIIAAQLPETDYDIILLQEAFSKSARKKIAKGLKDSHPYQLEPKGGRKLKHILGSGLFVASKYPIEVLGQKVYKDCTHSDCFSSKMAFLVEVSLPDGKKMQMVNTHLQAWDDQKAMNIRKKQFQNIRDLLDAHINPEVPQFLIGDLNVDAKKDIEVPVALEIMGMQNDELTGELSGTNGFKVRCYKTPGREKESQWLDHVWINPHESGAQVVSRQVRPFFGELNKKSCPLSDHHAVESIIAL